MKDSKKVMKEFMAKLANGEFDRVKEPAMGDEFNPTDKFITQSVYNYNRLLKSGLIPPFDEDKKNKKGKSLKKKKSR